jgi:peptidyl-prolyl cis-trans isomerase A (cyclophilin A)
MTGRSIEENDIMHLKTVGTAVAVAVALVAGSAVWSAQAKLTDPSKLTAKAPETFKARFETTKGAFVIEVHRAWAPHGADRFYNLVTNGYYDGVKFFRVVPGFVVQWGIHGDPAIATTWLKSTIQDDPATQSNTRGYVTFAMSGRPNSRSVQVFINLVDSTRLDAMGFAPFGKVVEGMDVVDKLYAGYGEALKSLQGRVAEEGNAFLEKNYPELDAIKKASIE